MTQLIYIYAYENLINNKIYVGQTIDIITRDYHHVFYGHDSMAIDNAIQKYSRENFNLFIITIVNNIEQANQEEIFWVAEMRRLLGKKQVYNLTDGGGGSLGRVISEEARRKISTKNIGRKRTEESKLKQSLSTRGRRRSPEHIKNAAAGLIGHTVSEETKQKISKSHTGKKASEETKIKMSNNRKGKPHKPHLEESKQKMSRSHKGKIVSEEAKANMSKAQTGRKHSEETKNKMRAKRYSEETKNKIRDNNKQTKLNIEKVNEIRKLYLTGNYTSRQLAKQFNVGKSTILRVLKNESWSHLEYKDADHVITVLSNNISEKFMGSGSGENNPSAKLNHIIAEQIRNQYITGKYTFKQLAQKFNVGATTIGRVIRNELWVK